MTTHREALAGAIKALEEIALAGMSGTGQETEQGMRDWHARRAWEFIGIAARALEPARAAQASADHTEDTRGMVALAPSRAGRVYLAGPMTGYPEWNFPAFNAAAAALRAGGAEVVNPAEHGIVEGAEWADYLRFDIAKIAICESIALLPGWSKSRGAQLEVHIAQALGMPLRYLDGAERPGAAAAVRPDQFADARNMVNPKQHALLAELAECNACDPNRNRSNAGVWTTVNVPTALWKRVLAAAQAQEGSTHG